MTQSALKPATWQPLALLKWLGVVPFVIFALLFLILPTLRIVVGAFLTPEGSLTFANIGGLFKPTIMQPTWVSIKLSAVTAFFGMVFGFLIALAISRSGLPRVVRSGFLTFSGVAANFAGVPLAFAFITTLGRLGLVTILLKNFGINLGALGFDLISFVGLVITYLYFQIPLMVLIIIPALDALKLEWQEAAESLGANRWQYTLRVALPILWPSLLGSFALLFANAFGAVATPIALTGSGISILPIILHSQIRGDVLGDPHLGYALAFSMIVITGCSNLIYILMRNRAERWVKRHGD
jgi:putative spermidine/putrescine transport system permease protein